MASWALQRLHSGFRPATWAQYSRMFRDFLAFLEKTKTHISKVNTLLLLSYMEYLHQKGLSHANISNHMAAICASFIIYGLDTMSFKDDRITLFIKALRINAPLTLKPTQNISIDMLHNILHICQTLEAPTVFQALYLFTYFSFLRLSNILPHAIKQFDPTRHLTRGDLFFSPNFCTIIIKWSKTLQDRKSFTSITIPYLATSPLCPVTALQNMFSSFPASKNSPLFSLLKRGVQVPLTDSVARKHLKQVSTLLKIDPPLTFHLFRRSATTWAFHNGVPMQHIMHQGTWSSNAVWRYIQSLPSQPSLVSQTFQQRLSLL